VQQLVGAVHSAPLDFPAHTRSEPLPEAHIDIRARALNTAQHVFNRDAFTEVIANRSHCMHGDFILDWHHVGGCALDDVDGRNLCNAGS